MLAEGKEARARPARDGSRSAHATAAAPPPPPPQPYDEGPGPVLAPPSRGEATRCARFAAFAGELRLHKVTFSYPACAAAPSSSSSASAYASNLNLSADAPALCNISLFPRATETTFVGDGSRFGKSSPPPPSSGCTPRSTARCALTSRMCAFRTRRGIAAW
ncbi:hypothetical protein LshimejAT787_1502170 [Lyophyllum shimeji]|uniref:Uncharacterized protein n=1 Tax=Lyophyllum shimeji TaxID=47721 RepID=A0A9P3USW7_LYOSH|nr:hypothetical protein LshimejAT787_1502170 [Lyophyllum shimeji]